MSPNNHFEYSEMILRVLDGHMNDEEFPEFDRLLREDASFRQYYLKFMAVNTSLGAIDKFPVSRVTENDSAILSDDLWNELAREEQTAETIEIEITVSHGRSRLECVIRRGTKVKIVTGHAVGDGFSREQHQRHTGLDRGVVIEDGA